MHVYQPMYERGVGGFCTPNNFYTGSAATDDGRRHSRNRATR